jgi:HrpA-like RNA helicase
VLPPIVFPPSRRAEIVEATAVEARHFAAAYALFRVSSMKNTHMAMPPKYKDLWKGLFADLKKEDAARGLQWMYEADPFAAAKAKEDAEKLQAKKREEDAQRAKKAEASASPFPAGQNRGWENAPSAEMGKRLRYDVESEIRQSGLWNSHEISITQNDQKRFTDDISKLGFRRAHVEEAAEICKDKEEMLEWLLTMVPEDDLPKWSLPSNYVSGVSMASSDLKREASIKNLVSAGYAADLCEELWDAHSGNQRIISSALQALLLQLPAKSIPSTEEEVAEDTWEDPWTEEQAVLESIYGERCTSEDGLVRIKLRPVSVNTELTVEAQKPVGNYPMDLPIIFVKGPIPAYIRLSITKQALLHAKESFIGEQMVFNIVDWLEHNIAAIVANPGRLSAVSTTIPTSDPQDSSSSQAKRRFRRAINWTVNSKISNEIKSRWLLHRKSKQYQEILAKRQSLPAWRLREQVAKAIADNRVTIITGETGSGKSTQSVQFVLDDLIEQGLGEAANIICTQPRRISAIGLADRIAEERGGHVGDEVGYIIRGESRFRRGTTKITFVTTGVLLRQLQTAGGSEADMDDALRDVSHVFIDEVHERAVDADFLLVIMRDMLKRRRDLRVVLMSATIDPGLFEQYFYGVGSVAHLHVEGRTYPVTDYYKDDIIRFTGHFADDRDEMDEKAMSAALVASGMRINYDLILKTIEHIDTTLGKSDGGILIFLPGAFEIDQVLQKLRNRRNFHALPLHASLPPKEQKRVFQAAPKGLRKVIAATNVAETSITIPDIVAVIDTGRVKEMTFDPVSSLRRLDEMWASQAACKQRRGRAGRVREGLCYKLYTRNVEMSMRERPDPEMLRVPLEQLYLSVKSMGVKDVKSFLGSALTPPSSQAIDTATQLLNRVGALDNGELTALGRHMAVIPADLKCAKLLVLGSTFGCTDACLGIAALLSSRSPFFNPMDKRDEVKQVRFEFAPGQGDLLSDLRAFETWRCNQRQMSERDLRAWCQERFLSIQTLREVESNRAQLASSLKEQGFLPLDYAPRTSPATTAAPSSPLNAHGDNNALLRALLCAAMHPQIQRVAFPATRFAASHTGSVALDPEARAIKYFDAAGARGFVHPGSACFDAPRGWASDVRFLAVWERVRVGGQGGGAAGAAAQQQQQQQQQDRGRTYLRGVTPCNTFSVLMFAGPLAVDTMGRGMLVDGWIRVRGWARIGVLVARLRGLLDRVLERKVDEPMRVLSPSELRVLDLVRRLVERDGMDR